MVNPGFLAPLVLALVGWSAFVRPQCLLCPPTSGPCEQFDGSPIALSEVIVECSNENVGNNTVNATSSLFSDPKTFAAVRRLNASFNALENFTGQFDLLVNLDLSHNAINNISQFQSPQLVRISLDDNNLTSLCDFTHPALQKLDAARNQIAKLCLGQLPQLTSLNLGENRISTIDKHLSERLTRLEILNLSSNAIVRLDDYNFNLSSLLRLHLGNNRISYLSEKCFYGLSRLQVLDISDNLVTTVFPSMFQYIPLVQLIVSNNPGLMTQDFGILLASGRLKIVNASRTNQYKIPACLTRSVRYLSLSRNTIAQIQCGDLDSYPLLNTLDLSYNNISFIEDDALGRLELLETIILSHNRLTFIPYTLSSNLKALHLNRNNFNKIGPSDFTGLLKLEYLDLSESNVSSVADGSFSQMYGLLSLNLSTNPIQNVSIGTLSGPHKLRTLDLSGLANLTNCQTDLCFPVPEPNELSELYIQRSPELGLRLMNDAAALKTFKQLSLLNMEMCNLSAVVTEVSNYFPRLKYLNLRDNELNCSTIRELYVWSEVVELGECRFTINEKIAITTTKSPVPTVGEASFLVSTTPHVELHVQIANRSLSYSKEVEVVSNEILIDDDEPGTVDAYSAEAPSSHPGLFLMLLVPVALAGTVFFINYSRLKRRVRTERRREMDIEISNISSELW